jgi:GTPase Era involved in 16S rRNA processing
MTEPTVAARFARWVTELTLADVPPTVAARASLLALDTLGNALAASTTPFGRAAIDTAERLGGRPEIVAATKVDTLPEGPERDEVLRRLAREVDRDVHPISAVSGTGLKALLAAVGQALRKAGPPPGPAA